MPSKRRRLTQKAADAAKPEAAPYQITDTDIPGFVLRIQPSGTKLWKLRYTEPSGTRTVRTLGRLPITTAAMAEEKAKAILRGDDPDVIPEQEPAPEVLTFGKFLEEHYAPWLQQHHEQQKPINLIADELGITNTNLCKILYRWHE